jgi:hypothetical protein
MAAGMNWGILSLLAMIVVVLGCVAGFFVFLARRSTAVAADPNSAPASSPIAEADADSRDKDALQIQTLVVRAGLKKVTALAHQRDRCGHLHKEGSRLSMPCSRG